LYKGYLRFLKQESQHETNDITPSIYEVRNGGSGDY
jgi:hypothetical protein